ncbi:MAG: glucose-1-phosphate cytidylyltransferase [Magnetococcales bacterium]|nr:glucose-1-phosphate cytidylyltransferase [Magnetococcales bacterium]
MKVVILCGGYGTRIRDVSESAPKPMIPIGSFPIIWHIMKHYAHYGHREFVLCLGYKAHVIKDFFLNYQALTNDFTLTFGAQESIEYHSQSDITGWKITLADTGLDALTGTRVLRIQDYLRDDEDFFLTYGDGVGSVDLDALLAFHQSHGRALTVTGVRPPGRFGELGFDHDSGQIREFNEKPQVSEGRISGGFFVCRKGFLDALDPNENQMFEQEPMTRLVQEGQVMVYRHDDFWQCMDTYRDYKLLNRLWEAGDPPWKCW